MTNDRRDDKKHNIFTIRLCGVIVAVDGLSWSCGHQYKIRSVSRSEHFESLFQKLDDTIASC